MVDHSNSGQFCPVFEWHLKTRHFHPVFEWFWTKWPPQKNCINFSPILPVFKVFSLYSLMSMPGSQSLPDPFQLSSNLFMQNKLEEKKEPLSFNLQNLGSPMKFGLNNPPGGSLTGSSAQESKQALPPTTSPFGLQQATNISGGFPMGNQLGGLSLDSSNLFNSQKSNNSKSIFNIKPAATPHSGSKINPLTTPDFPTTALNSLAIGLRSEDLHHLI